MTHKYKVSVIIPTWNRAYCIESAINSVLTQTIKSIEIIICDDGSSDNTREIVLSMCKKYSNIYFIPNPQGNSGKPAVPRNIALKNASGEWIAFLDSDDIWLDNKIELQLNALYISNDKASCTNCYKVNKKQESKLTLPVENSSSLNFLRFLKSNPVATSSCLIHSSLLKEIDFFPTQDELTVYEDYAYWLRVATLTNFTYLKEPLVIYNDDSEESIRKIFTSSHLKLIFYLILDYYKWTKTKSRYTPKRLLALLSFFYHLFLFFTHTHLLFLRSITKRLK